ELLKLRVVNGGYLDNSAASTATEIARALRGQPVYAIIIRDVESAPLKPETNQIPQALLAVGETRAVTARRELVEAVGADHVFEFDLVPTKPSLPLGWVLSDITRELIDQEVQGDHNRAVAYRLVAM